MSTVNNTWLGNYNGKFWKKCFLTQKKISSDHQIIGLETIYLKTLNHGRWGFFEMEEGIL